MRVIYLSILLLALAACASHKPSINSPIAKEANDTEGLEISITLPSEMQADSLLVYPVPDTLRTVYFTYKMEPSGDGNYSVIIPPFRRGMPYNRDLNPRPPLPKGERFGDTFYYNIVVFDKGNATTYPGREKGTPTENNTSKHYEAISKGIK